MVVGKLLILLSLSNYAVASDLENPRFFEYRSGGFANRLLDISFGWFKTLDDEQKSAYYQSITHALEYAENGQSVEWYKNDASGVTTPVMTWPTGTGYCRHIQIEAIAYNTRKVKSATACFDNASSNWRWISNKY